MAEFFDALTDDHRAFIERQPVFFVATAAPDARINLSPKGMDCFRVLGDKTVAYLDVAGSGNETNAHLAADGRITIMFCAFDNPALIFRIYGRGVAILPEDDRWAELAAYFTLLPGTRQIFEVAIDQVQTSCGWGVPHMSFERERQTLSKYHETHGDDVRFAKYAVRTKSIDGLPSATRPAPFPDGDPFMSLVEVGRFDRNLAFILIGRTESEGIPALALDGNASIADGSALFIPVRVMVDDEDEAAARKVIADAA